MVFQRLKEIGREHRWYQAGSTVFGLYKNLFFTLGDGQGFKFMLARVDGLSKEVAARLESELDASKTRLGFSERKVAADGVYLKFREAFRPIKKETLCAAMDFVVALFARHQLPTTDSCAECHSRNGVSVYTSNTGAVAYCSSCHAKLRDALRLANVKYETEEKHYVRGVAGATLLSLAGIIGWVVLAYYLNRVWAGMAFVFAFLANKGYDLFQAKRGKFTPVIIVGLNILSVIISNYATLLFILLRRGLGWSTAWHALLTNEKIAIVLRKEIAMSMALCALAWIYLGYAYWKAHRNVGSLKPAVPIG
jgi:hypothetical protein